MKEITNIADYINQIDRINTYKKILGGTKIYRGCPNKDFEFIPSIGRQISDNTRNEYITFETIITKKAQLKMPELFLNHKYPIQILTTVQHYGLPTRLLDFTRSSLVALYFACQDTNADIDGKVTIYNESEFNINTCYSPIVNAIAEISSLDNIQIELENYIYYLETKSYWSFFDYNGRTLEEKMKKVKTMFRPVFFEPENNFERLKRQQGLFLLFPNKFGNYNNNSYITQKLQQWKPKKESIIEIIIPNKIKNKLLNSLKNMGITKSFLFPEPEHICVDIKEELPNSYF